LSDIAKKIFDGIVIVHKQFHQPFSTENLRNGKAEHFTRAQGSH